MPKKHSESTSAHAADRARRVLHVRRRRDAPADAAAAPPRPRRRGVRVMVASCAAIAACLFAFGVYVIVRQGVLFAPGAASAEQGDEPPR